MEIKKDEKKSPATTYFHRDNYIIFIKYFIKKILLKRLIITKLTRLSINDFGKIDSPIRSKNIKTKNIHNESWQNHEGICTIHFCWEN